MRMKFWYEWEDVNDPHATGHPEFDPEFRLRTKKAALADFREYASARDFDWKPKIRLWRVWYEEVTR